MDLTIEQAMQQGVAAHKEGKPQEAERLYRAVLQSQPKHPDANHNLGILAVLVNKSDVALPLFKIALEANPKIEQFWLSYIGALLKQSQFQNAKRLLKKARKKGFDGDKFGALETQLKQTSKVEEPKLVGQEKKCKSPSEQDLSSLLAHYQSGNYKVAEKLALSITQEFPYHSFAWKVLGAVFKQRGKPLESLVASQMVASIDPEDAEAHNNLAVMLQELSRSKEAEISYKKAISLNPQYASAHNNLGVMLQDLHRLEEAQASYKQAIYSQPNHVDAHYNLGVTLQELSQLVEAEASFEQVIVLRPDFAEAHKSLGDVLQVLNRPTEAEVSFKKAIAIQPDFTDAFINLGLTLKELDRLGEAEASFRQAIVLKPDSIMAYNNLGSTLQQMDRLVEAEISFRQAIKIKPDGTSANARLGSLLHESGQHREGLKHLRIGCGSIVFDINNGLSIE